MYEAAKEHAETKLKAALCSFKCYLDEDIETFLHLKAIEYINRGWCSVYLILNEAQFLKGKLKIEAYFTLSHKTLAVNGNISKSKIQTIGGFKQMESLHFVLIGQLGKYISKEKEVEKISNINSKQILDYAFEVIKESSELIPCRCVMVECNDDPKVHKIYTNYGFKDFQHDGEHQQFFKLIN